MTSRQEEDLLAKIIQGRVASCYNLNNDQGRGAFNDTGENNAEALNGEELLERQGSGLDSATLDKIVEARLRNFRGHATTNQGHGADIGTGTTAQKTANGESVEAAPKTRFIRALQDPAQAKPGAFASQPVTSQSNNAVAAPPNCDSLPVPYQSVAVVTNHPICDPEPNSRLITDDSAAVTEEASSGRSYDSDGLAVATLVDEGMRQRELELPRAEHMAATRRKHQEAARGRSKGVALALSVLLALAVLVGSILLIFFRTKNDDTPSLVSGSATMRIPSNNTESFLNPLDLHDFSKDQRRLLALLPEATANIVTKEQDVYSSRYRAFSWLTEDPNVATFEDWRLRQRFALAVFYLEMGGDQWDENAHWLDHEIHECLWHSSAFITGLPCELEDVDSLNVTESNYGGIKHLLLWSNNLDGTLPEEVGWGLIALQTLSLSANNIQGSLPTFLPSSLVELHLSDNSVVGTIPTDLGLLTDLRELALTDNPLDGTVPHAIEYLPDLQYLNIENTDITGTIPSLLCIKPNLHLDFDCSTKLCSCDCSCDNYNGDMDISNDD